jgi:hypothetical protein
MYVHRKYSQNLLPQQAKRIGKVILTCFLIFETDLLPMENNGKGVKAVGMANAFVALADNVWAIEYNPAGLTRVKRIDAALFIIPEQFGLPELRTRAIGIAVPCSFATIGSTIEQFGFDLFKETIWRTGIGISIDQYVSIGMSLNLHHLNVSHYGASRYVTFNGGILTRVFEYMSIGFRVQNVTRTTHGAFAEGLLHVGAFGICWCPRNDLTLSIELEKDIRYPASVKAGVEQIILGILKLRAGLANNPTKFSAGVAVQYSSLEFGYAGYSHADLGWTHQIELGIMLGENR